ncbi:hypothetical protein CGZ96_16875 [Enemella evansiae]|uniref:hypothetical protein n=1 Tax=Enemella evansiae TaxID=2016499 RepID=UPI000B96701A|nr:hypothetical protein [Enemella evansiae]OYN95111.1 hypothetical protein CGZ96_16875 [Enemella evansiae]
MRFDVPVDHDQLRRTRRRAKYASLFQVAVYLIAAVIIGTMALTLDGAGGFLALALLFLTLGVALAMLLLFGRSNWYSGADVPPAALTLDPWGVTAYIERQPARQIPWPQARLSLGSKMGQPMLRLDSPGQKPLFWGTKILAVPPAEIDRAIRAMTNGQRALGH